PDNQPSGNYSGSITVNSSGQPATVLTLNVNVLPFDLAPSSLDYGLYYKGSLSIATALNSDSTRSQKATLADCQDMYAHGVLYPAYYYQDPAALDMMRSAGMPTDKVFNFGQPKTGNSSTSSTLTTLKNSVSSFINTVRSRTGWANAQVF